MDINVKKLKKNAFRVSKVRGETASRIRMPGGYVDAESLKRIAEVFFLQIARVLRFRVSKYRIWMP